MPGEEANGRKASLFNISVDTGVLFAMLLAAVYFGAMLRSDVDHAITAIIKLDDKVTTKSDLLEKEVSEIKQRVLVLENKPLSTMQPTP